MSTNRGDNKSCRLVFTGRREAHRTIHNVYTSFPVSETYRREIRFQGTQSCLKRKENANRKGRVRSPLSK